MHEKPLQTLTPPQSDMSTKATLVRPTAANTRVGINVVTGKHFVKQAKQELDAVSDRVNKIYGDHAPAFGELLGSLLAPTSGSNDALVGHFLTVFNRHGPVVYGDSWVTATDNEVYSFIRVILAAAATGTSFTEVYDTTLSDWYADSVTNFDCKRLPRRRLSDFVKMLDDGISEDDMDALERLFSAAMVPFLPVTSYQTAYDDDQQRKGSKTGIKSAVSPPPLLFFGARAV